VGYLRGIIPQKSEHISKMATLGIINDYIAFHESSGKAVTTCKNYKSDLLLFAKWFAKANGEPMTLLKITPTDTRHYKRDLIESGYKPQTVNRRIISLNHFLTWGWESRNVKYRFALLKSMKQMKTAPRWLDKYAQHLLLRLVERSQKPRDIAIITLVMNTGLRVHELCALKWTDITIADRKGMLIVRSGKGEKYREIPLNKDARDVLLNMQYAKHAGTDVPIFTGQRGTLQVRGVQLMMKRLLDHTELKHVTPHQLRHTFCKNLINAEVGLEKVAALAGHESLDTTKLYCKPSLFDLQDAVERIGEHE